MQTHKKRILQSVKNPVIKLLQCLHEQLSLPKLNEVIFDGVHQINITKQVITYVLSFHVRVIAV